MQKRRSWLLQRRRSQSCWVWWNARPACAGSFRWRATWTKRRLRPCRGARAAALASSACATSFSSAPRTRWNHARRGPLTSAPLCTRMQLPLPSPLVPSSSIARLITLLTTRDRSGTTGLPKGVLLTHGNVVSVLVCYHLVPGSLATHMRVPARQACKAEA